MKERRSHIRYPVNFTVKLLRAGVPSASSEGVLIDVSSGGVGINVHKELKKGTDVVIEWSDPPFYVEGDAIAKGRVISVEKDREGYRLGIRFSDTDSEVTRNLLNWVHREVSRQKRAQSGVNRLSRHTQKVRF